MINLVLTGQGLGVSIHGMVFSKKEFKSLTLKVVGLAITGIGSLLALAPAKKEELACTPTDLQVKIVHDLFSNTTCLYNTTIGELLAMR